MNSFLLHIIAMFFMLLDHAWRTVVVGNSWMTCVGRLAFPIFIFLIVEGYFHAHHFPKYLFRLFVFALLSEIPFDLMLSGSIFYPAHQNVLWEMILILLCIHYMEREKTLRPRWLSAAVQLIILGSFCLLAEFLRLDYGKTGILAGAVLYLFRGNTWKHRLCQLAGFVLVFIVLYRGYMLQIPIGNMVLSLPREGLAVLSLPFLWLYSGKQGPHNKAIQYAFYAFYPIHLLVLWMFSARG